MQVHQHDCVYLHVALASAQRVLEGPVRRAGIHPPIVFLSAEPVRTRVVTQSMAAGRRRRRVSSGLQKLRADGREVLPQFGDQM